MSIEDFVQDLAEADFGSESEVRSRVVVPLFKLLGYPDVQRAEEFPVYTYRGRKALPPVRADFVFFDSAGHAGRRGREDRRWAEDHSLVVVETKDPNARTDDNKSAQDTQNQARSYALWLKTPLYVITDGKELLVYRVRGFSSDELAFGCLLSELKPRWPELPRLLGPEAVLRYCRDNEIKVNDPRVTDYTDYLRRTLSNLGAASGLAMERTVSEPEGRPASRVGKKPTLLFKGDHPKRVPYGRLLEVDSSVVVLGEPGSGKTHLTEMLLRRAIRACEADPTARIPVVLPGRSWSRDSEIERCIYKEIAPALSGSTEQMVREDLNDGRFLLLVDGLDEAPKRGADALHDELRRVVHGTGTRAIVTCRSYDYRHGLGKWLDECVIDPLSRAQIEDHVSRSLSGITNDGEPYDKEVGRRFMFSARPGVATLVRNPLLLEMTLAVMRARPQNDLPEREADLYASYVGLLLESWPQRSRSRSPEVGRGTKERVLAEYARLTWERPADEDAFDEALRNVLGTQKTRVVRDELLKSGLLKDEPDGPEFYHPSFKDYFAALGVFHRRPKGELMRLPGRVLRYVPSDRRKLERVIAGFDGCDVLLRSRLDPELFRRGSSLNVPHMLWLVNGCWFGVDGVNVGYGGTGPDEAHQALKEAGVSEADAESSRRYRFFDLDLVSGYHDQRKEGLLGLELPVPHGSVFVVEFAAEDVRGTYEFDQHVCRRERGVPDRGGLTSFEAWVRYLDLDPADLPAWLRGPRVARYFTTYETARSQGFDDGFGTPLGKEGPYPLIIEQGRLQLWVPVTLPLGESTRLLKEETRHALAFANLYSSDLARLDAQGRVARYLHRIARRPPGYFDFSSGSGDSTASSISYVPARSNAAAKS